MSYRTALVTGASSGIGEEFARQLAAAGTDLIIVARRVDRLEQLAKELRANNAVTVEVLAADLASAEGLDRVAERVGAPDPGIELLVNNAGFGTAGDFHELPYEREAEQVRLNVLAVQRLTHAALSAMLPRHHGGILNVSSLAGDQPLPGSATYGATKAFVTSFSQSLRGEVRRQGVHVTALLPGFVRTELSAESTAGLPDLAWVDIHLLVREALNAVERGQALCIPSAKYKALSALVQALPRGLVREVAARVRPIG
ncbi:MAG TPA: SDR family oxidoreductase [Mycobacteriales bacterium]|nr:SDR family oxidoreductase [Mycobacteriales bacterium]